MLGFRVSFSWLHNVLYHVVSLYLISSDYSRISSASVESGVLSGGGMFQIFCDGQISLAKPTRKGGAIKFHVEVGARFTYLYIHKDHKDHKDFALWDAADNHYTHCTLEFRSVMALLRQRIQCRQLRLPGWDNICLSPFHPFMLVFLVLLKDGERCWEFFISWWCWFWRRRHPHKSLQRRGKAIEKLHQDIHQIPRIRDHSETSDAFGRRESRHQPLLLLFPWHLPWHGTLNSGRNPGSLQWEQPEMLKWWSLPLLHFMFLTLKRRCKSFQMRLLHPGRLPHPWAANQCREGPLCAARGGTEGGTEAFAEGQGSAESKTLSSPMTMNACFEHILAICGNLWAQHSSTNEINMVLTKLQIPWSLVDGTPGTPHEISTHTFRQTFVGQCGTRSKETARCGLGSWAQSHLNPILIPS